MGISALVPIRDRGIWKAKWTIHMFKDPGNRIHRLAERGIPLSVLVEQYRSQFLGVLEIERNCLLNVGINQIWCLVCGTGGTQWSAANAYIAVGTATMAANATQTGLQATGTASATATMVSGYPTYNSSQQATWQASFGTGVANFAWGEITVLNSAAGTALNRLVQTMGTKASGTTWVATLQITLA
jgi:hypothetical protein